MSLLNRVLAMTESGEQPAWRPGKLLPGEIDMMSSTQRAERQHQQRLLQSKLRFVTFRLPIGDTRDFSVIASTEKSAVQRARFTHHIPRTWVAIAVDRRPFKEQT